MIRVAYKNLAAAGGSSEADAGVTSSRKPNKTNGSLSNVKNYNDQKNANEKGEKVTDEITTKKAIFCLNVNTKTG